MLHSYNNRPEHSARTQSEKKEPSFRLFFEKNELLLNFCFSSVKIRPTEDFFNRKLESLKMQINKAKEMQLLSTGLTEELSQLPIFPDYILPTADNGFDVKDKPILFTFVLKEDETNAAAIHFSILEGKECNIKILSVLPAHQGKGLGTILLQVGVYIASLYGCSKVSLESLQKNLSFFYQFGFKREDDEEFLGSKCDDSVEELLLLKGYSLALTMNNECLEEFNNKFKINFPHIEFLNVLNYVKQMYGLFNLLLKPKIGSGLEQNIAQELMKMDVEQSIILPQDVRDMIYRDVQPEETQKRFNLIY